MLKHVIIIKQLLQQIIVQILILFCQQPFFYIYFLSNFHIFFQVATSPIHCSPCHCRGLQTAMCYLHNEPHLEEGVHGSLTLSHFHPIKPKVLWFCQHLF